MIDTSKRTTIKTKEELEEYIGNKKEVEFKNLIIRFSFTIDDSKLTKIIFNNVEFEGSVYMKNCRKIDSLEFIGVIFHYQLAIMDTEIRSSFSIINSHFYKDVNLANINCKELNFEGLTIGDQLFLMKVLCSDICQISNIKANELSIYIEAKSSIQVWNLHIEKDADLGLFSKKGINIHNSTFTQNLDLSITSQETYLNKLVVFDTFSFRIKTSQLTMFNLIVKGISFFTGIEIKNANRDAYRFIKNEFLKLNNKIDALTYQKKEMIAFWHELIKNFKYEEKKSYSTIPDIIVLGISWLTNNFGLSYIRAFFLYIAATYGILFLISDYSFTWQFKFELLGTPEFWHFLNPTHRIEEIASIINEKSSWVLMGNLIARIVQGFLIYQFIRAFRKFNYK